MQELHTGLKSVFPFAAGSVNDWYLTHIEILTIIYLTREPLASAHLAAGKIFNYGIAPYFTRAGALFFVLYYCDHPSYSICCVRQNSRKSQGTSEVSSVPG